ncbi:hypothetical protein DEO72_LG3g1511 [Vigna unguiculata]|uniref:Uncharacterized protein n=1 Tax=Vigna unguiculata TaxID=3917 RepID=A0A4D6LER5_VIGUN|nr:hypothetical protein DEO72_LG3g1511 [Vigna unguiculata]
MVPTFAARKRIFEQRTAAQRSGYGGRAKEWSGRWWWCGVQREDETQRREKEERKRSMKTK